MQILPNGDPSSWTLTNVNDLINNVIILAADLAGIIAVIFLMIGAIQYFTAFGNEEKANKGKTTITWAIVGIIVIILARVIVNEIFAFIR